MTGFFSKATGERSMMRLLAFEMTQAGLLALVAGVVVFILSAVTKVDAIEASLKMTALGLTMGATGQGLKAVQQRKE